jgi:DNA-binding transcriptional ArsR family regulator
MSDNIDAARKLITNRLSAIEAEAGQLRRALEELGEIGGSVPATPKPRRKPAASKRRRRAQAPRGQRREQLLGVIAANPGARPSEFAAEIGISPSQVSALIAVLRKEKLIVKQGVGYALKK